MPELIQEVIELTRNHCFMFCSTPNTEACFLILLKVSDPPLKLWPPECVVHDMDPLKILLSLIYCLPMDNVDNEAPTAKIVLPDKREVKVLFLCTSSDPTLATNGTHCYPVCNHFYLLLLSSLQSLPPFTQLSGATKWVFLITSKGQLMLRPTIKYHSNLYLFSVYSVQFIQCQSKQVRLKGFYFRWNFSLKLFLNVLILLRIQLIHFRCFSNKDERSTSLAQVDVSRGKINSM